MSTTFTYQRQLLLPIASPENHTRGLIHAVVRLGLAWDWSLGVERRTDAEQPVRSGIPKLRAASGEEPTGAGVPVSGVVNLSRTRVADRCQPAGRPPPPVFRSYQPIFLHGPCLQVGVFLRGSARFSSPGTICHTITPDLPWWFPQKSRRNPVFRIIFRVVQEMTGQHSSGGRL